MNTNVIDYGKYGKCLRIDNQIVDLVIPLEMGIRIVRYGFIDDINLFCEAPDLEIETSKDESWKIYGGHRLWHSPENNPRTYFPDANPIQYEVKGNTVVLKQSGDTWANMKKQIDITLEEGSTKVKLLHRITNDNLWPVEFSAWALTVMTTGGIEVVPFSAEDTGLLHNRQLSIWPYTKMNDDRVYFGNKYITIKQDTKAEMPFKIGLDNVNGWAAYVLDNKMFVKKYRHMQGEPYPDNNVSFETYSCHFMTEIESLSPLRKIDSNDSIEHIEEWEIVKDIQLTDPTDERELDCIVSKITVLE